MKKYFSLGLIFILLLCLGVLVSLTQQKTSVTTLPEKPRVAATIFPLYDIVKEIVGDVATVDLILPPGASPHTFEPTPQIVRRTQEARVIFAIGYGLDDWSLDLANDPSLVQTVEYGIALRSPKEKDHGPIDPHYWLTAQNAMRISETVRDRLLTEFPEQEDQLNQNFEVYLKKLEELDTTIKNKLAPLQNKTLITFHDAWYYFADAYDLTIAATFEPTVGREPTAQYLAELSKLIEQTHVRVLYAEPQFSPIGMEALISNKNIRIVTIDPEGGGAGSTSYISLMRSNVETIVQNQ